MIDAHQQLIGAIERREVHAAGLLMGAHPIETGKHNLMQRAAKVPLDLQEAA